MIQLDTSEIPGDSDVPDIAIEVRAGQSMRAWLESRYSRLLVVIAAIRETGVVVMVEPIAVMMN